MYIRTANCSNEYVNAVQIIFSVVSYLFIYQSCTIYYLNKFHKYENNTVAYCKYDNL